MQPLLGLKIITVEQYGAGPFGTMFLANLGAEVIKIENPNSNGDVSRGLGPYFLNGEDSTQNSLFFQQLNHNKRSMTLDLTTKEGSEIMKKLVAGADALACNLRGDVPAKLGLTYSQLSSYNPKLVCAHLTAYGRDNERAKWPGYDYMAQAEAGYFHLTGEPDSPPSRMGLSMIDFMTGVTLAFALLAGIVKARETGIGCDMDTCLFDVAIYNLNYVAMWYLNAGHNQPRVARSAHFSLTPCQLYKSADGWIYIMCNKEKFWHRFCERINHPQLIEDERFNNYDNRLQNRDELTLILDEILQQKTTADWIQTFNGEVPSAPILDVQQALSNPFVQSRNLIAEVKQGSKESFKLLRGPVLCDGKDVDKVGAPSLGQDTDDILTDLGYSKKHISRLKALSVI